MDVGEIVKFQRHTVWVTVGMILLERAINPHIEAPKDGPGGLKLSQKQTLLKKKGGESNLKKLVMSFVALTVLDLNVDWLQYYARDSATSSAPAAVQGAPGSPGQRGAP